MRRKGIHGQHIMALTVPMSGVIEAESTNMELLTADRVLICVKKEAQTRAHRLGQEGRTFSRNHGYPQHTVYGCERDLCHNMELALQNAAVPKTELLGLPDHLKIPPKVLEAS